MRRAVAALVVALLLPSAAVAGAPAPGEGKAGGRQAARQVVKEPLLTKRRATEALLAHGKVADWLERYPLEGRSTDAKYERKYRNWTVRVWWREAGEVATGKVDDATGAVTEAWTGPQVAWKMARGYKGAFGGEKINSAPVWLAFCLVFFVGLADLRRPLSVRNLDLLVLLSFSASLWFFNQGDIFTSMPLVYPPLVYLLGRMIWIGWRGRAATTRPLWPVWLLAAATVFLAGFRVGLNVRASNVIDVGYAGVIGADRIASGQAPYGHMPVQGDLKACGPADTEGEIRDRIQTNGRCESSNDQGDTYGPVSYAAYLPGYAVFGWTGKWDDLPAAHLTSILFDLLCLAGLALVGRRFGGPRLAATLAFAWAAYPFTQYVSSSNTNDAIMPAFLIWGFWLVTSPWARGAAVALAGWTKFAALLVAPLWAAYPDAGRLRPLLARSRAKFAAAFVLATLVSFSVLLLEPDPVHAARVFYDRTLGWQIGRESPFSIWDWKQYHASGLPDLERVQLVLQVLLVVGAIALYFVPRRRSPLQFAALTGALLVGFELVLTHWFYLYLPWFFPFVAFAVLASTPAAAPVEAAPASDGAPRELVAAG